MCCESFVNSVLHGLCAANAHLARHCELCACITVSSKKHYIEAMLVSFNVGCVVFTLLSIL